MFNTLAAPGEVFTELKNRPVRHSNWAVPAILYMVIGSVLVLLLFSQETFMHEIMKQQSKAMDQQVEKGKLTRAQADQFEAASAGWMPMVMKIGGVIATIGYAFGIPFFWGFVIWIVSEKVFDADVEYMKAVEAAGLSLGIQLVGMVISSLASLAMSRLISISPAILVGDLDFTNRLHLVLGAINPFYIWFTVTVAVSVSVLAGVPLKRAAMWTLGVWVVHRAILLAIPQTGQFVM